MSQIHETTHGQCSGIVGEDVMPMVMLGAVRLKKIVFGECSGDQPPKAGHDADDDLSVEHVAVLGEN